MTPAELNSLCHAEGAYLARQNTGSVTPEMVQAFRAGHAAGYRDGLAARQSEAVIRRDTVCPDCGADWTVVAEMLAELPTWEPLEPPIGNLRRLVETGNHSQARHILANCRTCREHFAPKACGPPCGNYPAKTADECTFCKCR